MSEDQVRSRRTHFSNRVYQLPGGNEDNDLWVREEPGVHPGTKIMRSTYVLTDEQRARVAAGENIEVCLFGSQPPVVVLVTDVPIGKPPRNMPYA